MKRNHFIIALRAHGLFKDYQDGDQLRDEVFQAAATLPCTEEEVLEAMALPAFLDDPEYIPEEVARLKQELMAQGVDLEKPNVAEKFFAWMRSST